MANEVTKQEDVSGRASRVDMLLHEAFEVGGLDVHDEELLPILDMLPDKGASVEKFFQLLLEMQGQ